VRVAGVQRRTIEPSDDGRAVEVIDQTLLPHAFVTRELRTLQDAAHAIRSMQVRGAPLIGVTAAYGVALQLREDPSDSSLALACERLLATRPTAVNLRWALEAMRGCLAPLAPEARAARAWARAAELADEDVALCRAIGEHGARLFEEAYARRKGEGALQILTHCNAGWLATVDWGTALAPVYVAHERGLPLHVWVDETRPRNQGASLTAWELLQHGVPHTVVADNAGGHLMQHGRVDLCITGSDRTTARGDVCNKIGTYLKALAARDNGVPFYVALPYSTIDWSIEDGIAEIPIEERDGSELSRITGCLASGERVEVTILPEGSPVGNPAFDVTPAGLVSALVTERGTCPASREGLLSLYPERREAAAGSAPPAGAVGAEMGGPSSSSPAEDAS
jgi:methylthioribose-1-phosphate isomerase